MTRLLWNGAIYAAALGVALVISISLTQPNTVPQSAEAPASTPVAQTTYQR